MHTQGLQLCPQYTDVYVHLNIYPYYVWCSTVCTYGIYTHICVVFYCVYIYIPTYVRCSTVCTYIYPHMCGVLLCVHIYTHICVVFYCVYIYIPTYVRCSIVCTQIYPHMCGVLLCVHIYIPTCEVFYCVYASSLGEADLQSRQPSSLPFHPSGPDQVGERTAPVHRTRRRGWPTTSGHV